MQVCNIIDRNPSESGHGGVRQLIQTQHDPHARRLKQLTEIDGAIDTGPVAEAESGSGRKRGDG